ncbi:MAG: hypothetical protein P4L85_17955 [Paludisphaera borealis]|uniref:hypothetical protein n=1 Tax=Paludisphaera borealis TaxID=1387353 RepID=UPI002850E81A|nr:hypothetical protein [Paludisphaera borealis]MDR3621241.1 hypothetical protein [Paludisphaera borealis]
MGTGRWVKEHVRFLGIVATILSGIGAVAGLFIILVRVPALADTKLEELLGTLLGAAVSLLFVVLALLINLTIMVYGATRRPTIAVGWGDPKVEGRTSPGV